MKILVVDDHVLIREALRGVLRELKGETTVILEASDSREAVRELEQHGDVELVLLDLNLPDRDGLDVLQELGARWPTVHSMRARKCRRRSISAPSASFPSRHGAKSCAARSTWCSRVASTCRPRSSRFAFRPMPLRHLRRVQI